MKIKIAFIITGLLLSLSSCSDILTTNPNVSPVIVASQVDYTLYPAISQTLDTSESYDDDDQELDYSWTVTSSPSGGDASLTNATESIATFSAVEQGTYTVTATVTDEYNLTDEADFTITVENDSPVALINADITDPAPAETVTLDGNTSYDPNEVYQVDDLDPFIWSLSDSPVATTWTWDGADATTSFTASTDSDDDVTFTPGTDGSAAGEGVYTIQLTVTDEYDANGYATVVLATNGNTPPELDTVTANLYTYSAGVYSFDGSTNITNTENDTLEYSWTITAISSAINLYVDGSLETLNTSYTTDTGTISTLSIAADGAYPLDGTNDFSVTLTVSDGAVEDTAYMEFDLY
jgi:uncharacterized repeat protein (TIGR01451 family)